MYTVSALLFTVLSCRKILHPFSFFCTIYSVEVMGIQVMYNMSLYYNSSMQVIMKYTKTKKNPNNNKQTAILMVIEPDNTFMPISHTHLTKYLSGIVGGKPAALTQSTYP
jgi:hypothetical protein